MSESSIDRPAQLTEERPGVASHTAGQKLNQVLQVGVPFASLTS